jgi:hypothetical protein
MGLRNDIDMKTSEEAAVWLHRLREEDGEEVRAAFSAWIKQGAGNLEEFLFAQAMWQELAHVDPALRHRLESVPGSEQIVDLASHRTEAAAFEKLPDHGLGGPVDPSCRFRELRDCDRRAEVREAERRLGRLSEHRLARADSLYG